MSNYKKHIGQWTYHDDNCWCVMGDNYCNRDGFVWSCCGSTIKDSECSAPNKHPSYWNHPLYTGTYTFENEKIKHISKDDIRKLSPESFE